MSESLNGIVVLTRVTKVRFDSLAIYYLMNHNPVRLKKVERGIVGRSGCLRLVRYCVACYLKSSSAHQWL